MKTHLGMFLYEVVCEAPEDLDKCSEDIEDVTCEECLDKKLSYLKASTLKIQNRLHQLRIGGTHVP